MKSSKQISLEAFRKTIPKRNIRYRQICEALAIYGPMSNEEIAWRARLPINCVTPRVLELRELGYIAQVGIKTNKNNYSVSIWNIHTRR